MVETKQNEKNFSFKSYRKRSEVEGEVRMKKHKEEAFDD